MKYIIKPEIVLYAKLTIAIAMYSILVNSLREDIEKQLVLKVYNKIESYREVGISKAITYILSYPDYYTNAIFVNIYITHLLRHMQHIVDSYKDQRIGEDILDIDIIIDNDLDNRPVLAIVSLFENYSLRGLEFAKYYLYNYCILVYKDRKEREISFQLTHLEYRTYK
jgi:hypothetical protein